MIRIDQSEVCPAVIESGSNNAYLASALVFCKPRWVSDEEAIFCGICRNKFNQLRRRHHCRCCGKVFCNKCCVEKVPLPQYGFDNPERVCSNCIPVASCVTMSFSNDPTFQLRAAEGLSIQTRESPSSIVALGGAHVLISLCKRAFNQIQTLAHVSGALHSLSCHECLTHWLADLGTFSAINDILKFCQNSYDQNKVKIAIDCLSALRLLVKTSNKLKVLAFQVGCFPSLFQLSSNTNPGVALIATSTLCILAECSENHSTFTAQQDTLQGLLLKVSKSSDEQVKEHVLRILVILSKGSNDVKHTIAAEDAACGGVLAHALQSKPNNLQIIASAASAIANLATNEKDQVLLQSCLSSVLIQLQTTTYPEYVRVQLIRAVANFSTHVGHSQTILHHFQSLVEMFNTNSTNILSHVFRCIFNLLKYRKKETVALLVRNGVQEFLLRFTELDDVMSQVISSLSQLAPPISS